MCYTRTGENMKLIHCADLHIDSRMKTHLNTHESNERKREILLTFERMVSFAIDNDVRAILIAGDMFDTNVISNASKMRLINIIRENSNIDFLYLVGNHDEENAIEEFKELDNLKLFDNKWSTYRYDNVNIIGTILNKSTNFDILNLDENSVNIVMLHGQISQYNVDGDEEIISLPKLRNKNIDYLALGHIHTYECNQLDNRGIYAYSGCLEGRGFDECGDKGFVLINVDGNRVDHEFVPFAKRKLYEIDYDISNDETWYGVECGIQNTLSDIDESSMIKINLIGRFSLTMEKQISFTEDKLKEKYYFVKIKDKSTLKLEEKDYMLDMSLRGEFIRKVMASDLSDEDKESVILLGVKALEGEELI